MTKESEKIFTRWDECRYANINEKISKKQLKSLIKERISCLFESEEKSKEDYFNDWKKLGMSNSAMQSKWNTILHFRKLKQLHQNKFDDSYLGIGFQSRNEVCWYWNASKHELIVGVGSGHHFLFGELPYENFRGRYDKNKNKVSITPPEINPPKITGDLHRDVSSEILNALKIKFPNAEIKYFPDPQ